MDADLAVHSGEDTHRPGKNLEFAKGGEILPACAGGYAEIVILHNNEHHGYLLPHEDKNFVSPPEAVV